MSSLLALSILALLPSFAAPTLAPGWHYVEVVDGDTVAIPALDPATGRTHRVRVRLVGPPGAPMFDAPECGHGMRRGRPVAHEPGCEAAREALRALVTGHAVYLEFVPCFSHNYGRPCALLYPRATPEARGEDVTTILSSEGRSPGTMEDESQDKAPDKAVPLAP